MYASIVIATFSVLGLAVYFQRRLARFDPLDYLAEHYPAEGYHAENDVGSGCTESDFADSVVVGDSVIEYDIIAPSDISWSSAAGASASVVA